VQTVSRRLAAVAGSLLLGVSGGGDGVQMGVDPPGTLTVVVVGDSITEMDSPDFDAGDIGAGSWAAYADGHGIRIIGGWAHSGATTAQMLAGVCTQALEADVLVILAGNNDIDHDVSTSVIEAQLEKIAGRVHAHRVVLSTVAPEDAVAPAVQYLNSQLPALARAQGWQMVDPMSAISDGHGHYLPGMTSDRVHPTLPAARVIGEALRSALIS
jgi:lysophospholipase L1-like esterase